jgi:hypothetical protein
MKTPGRYLNDVSTTQKSKNNGEESEKKRQGKDMAPRWGICVPAVVLQ